MIRRPPRSTLDRSSAASDVYKRQVRLVHRQPETGTLSVVEAVVETWIDYQGIPSYTLRNVNGEIVAPGNSGGGVWAEFTPAREHEGYLGMVHGGISATILDEAMNWAVTNEGDIAVTARMAVTYRRPLAVGRRVRVTARIDERRSRAIDTRAEIRQVDTEELLAEAEGRFMRVSAAQAEAWRDSYGMQYDDSPFADAARRTASANR